MLHCLRFLSPESDCCFMRQYHPLALLVLGYPLTRDCPLLKESADRQAEQVGSKPDQVSRFGN